jgi:hypothetical protein
MAQPQTRLIATDRAGVERLDQERDLNRLLLRDLRHFPDLLEAAAEQDIGPVHAALAGWIERQGGPDDLDTAALAAVIAGATSHYWLLSDIFGSTRRASRSSGTWPRWAGSWPAVLLLQHRYRSGMSTPCSCSGRGPKIRRSAASMARSSMLASRRRMNPCASNSHCSLP